MTSKLAQTDQTLLIINCAKSWQEVVQNQVYICPVQGASSNFKPARYFGVYHNLTVSHVANIEAVIDVDEQHNTTVRWLAGGGAEADYRARAVEKTTKLRQQADFPVRVILLDYLQATGFKKGSRGGMQNSKQYLDVSSVGVNSAGYLAGKLWDKSWSDFRAVTEASLAAAAE